MKYFALLFLGAGLATAVQAAAIITPLPALTYPQPTLNAANDAFYYTGVTISNSSTEVNNQNAVDSNNHSLNPYTDIFGNTVPYLCSTCYWVVFGNDITPSNPNMTFFTTSTAETITGYNLDLADNPDGERTATQFQLYANGVLVDTVNLALPGQTYQNLYGSNWIQVSNTFATPVTATSWEGVWVSDAGVQFPAPYVIDLQGIPGSNAPPPTAPEPSAMGLSVAGLLAGCLIAFRRRLPKLPSRA